MADTDYIINLVANIKDSQKSIEALSKSTDKTVKQIESQFSGLGSTIGASFSLLGAGLAAIGVGFTLKSAISEASKFEDTVRGLKTALELSGISSKQAVEGILDFADGLQKTTKFGDDAVISTASLIQSIARLPTDQLQRATKLTLDLSTALRIDLDSAARLVAKSAEGNIESFKRYGIEIKKGADNTETFSNALEVLESRFSGASEKAVQTYAGATAKLTNAASDAAKQFGLIITQNPEVIASINGTAEAFTGLSEAIKDNESVFSKAISAIIIGLKALAKAAIFGADGPGSITLLGDTKVLREQVDLIDEAIQNAKSYRSQQSRDNAALVAQKKADSDFQKSLTIAEEAKKKNAAKAEADFKALVPKAQAGAAARSSLKEITIAQEESAKKAGEEYAKALSKEQQASSEKNAQFALGSIASIPGGPAAMLSQLAASTGPLGAAAGGAFQFFAQGEEAVRAQTQAFIDQIPVIIDAFIAGIPAFIDVLAANAPHLATSLAAVMPVVATRLAIELGRQAPNIAKSFGDAMIAEATRIAQSIADGVKQAISQITNIAGGGGGTLGAIVNPLGAISKKLKFAEGGIVPGGAPYTDRIPAMLTPGEVVIPRDQVASLGGAGNIIVKLVLGEQELASTIVDLRARGFGV